MTPGERRLRNAVIFDFHMYWLRNEIVAAVDAGRSDPILRHDIANLMGKHQRDFDEGWPLHGMIPVPGWPDRPQWEN